MNDINGDKKVAEIRFWGKPYLPSKWKIKFFFY